MAENGNESGGFRITTGMIFTELQDVKKEVSAARTDLALLSQTVTALATAQGQDRLEVAKMRSRINGVYYGIGIGLLAGIGGLVTGVFK